MRFAFLAPAMNIAYSCSGKAAVAEDAERYSMGTNKPTFDGVGAKLNLPCRAPHLPPLTLTLTLASSTTWVWALNDDTSSRYVHMSKSRIGSRTRLLLLAPRRLEVEQGSSLVNTAGRRILSTSRPCRTPRSTRIIFLACLKSGWRSRPSANNSVSRSPHRDGSCWALCSEEQGYCWRASLGLLSVTA